MTHYKPIYDIILLFCMLFIINSCNQNTKKLITINEKKIDAIQNKQSFPSKMKITTEKVVKEEINISKIKSIQKPITNDVVFEFRNERLLHGRGIKKKKVFKKNDQALTAVFKMFKQNLSLKKNELDISNDGEVFEEIDYNKNKNNKDQKNILVLLPFTGPYSNFGIKIRKALDLSILNFGSNNVRVIYFDTGKEDEVYNFNDLLEKTSPQIVIGPFTRSSLLKVKPFIKEKSIPMFTFSNDIALVENNVWSLGFSPEEQVDSVISCALLYGHKRFGLIAPNNLYGKIVIDRSVGLIKTKNDNYFEKLLLSNSQLNNKSKLYSILRKFLNYNDESSLHSKFDSIFIGGSKEFILEIAPMLAYYDVDSKKIQILGTDKFNIDEIKNEPSLEKSWFPKIINRNQKDFQLIWQNTWNEDDNYFSNAAFDAGLISINYLKQEKALQVYLNDLKSVVTGFEFEKNGFVKKPISIVQVEKFGKLIKVEKCSN